MSTLAAAWMFIKSPVGRYTLGALALLALLAGLRIHFIHQGQLEGKQAATDQLTAQRAKEKEADRADTKAHLDQDDKIFQMYADKLDAAGRREEAAAQVIANLAAQRGQASQHVDGVPDAELRDFIIATLALRAKTDTTPGYTAQEQRAIAHDVVDDPLCRKEVDGFPAQVQACTEAKAQLTGQRDVKVQELATLAGYTDRLEGYYTDAFNAIPRNGNKWIRLLTFGLKGKPIKLALPSPIELKEKGRK